MSDPTRDAQLARIRALMAKTVDNGCTEAEAAAAAAAVDRLLATYELTLDEVNVRQLAVVQRTVKARRHLVSRAALAIAEFCDCMAWTYQDDIVFLGFAVDTEIAEYLTFLFKRAIDSGSAAHTLFNHEYDRATVNGRAEMVRSFGIGMAHRLGERLKTMKSARDFTAKKAGHSLVLVKKPMVQAAFDELGLNLGEGTRDGKARDPKAYAAGQHSADFVAINQGVAQRARSSAFIR